MAFDGYLSRGGVELINAERTQRYIENNLPAFPLRRIEGLDTIHVALEEEAYRSPLLDDAEWVNPSDPATHDFYGMYPLEISGIGDSTREATTTESILDGGTVGASRASTRSIRVRGLLIGADELAVEAGLSWLRAAVREDNCGMHGAQCGTSDLRYFLASPDVCEPKWKALWKVFGGVYATFNLGVDDSPYVIEMPAAPTMPIFSFTPNDGEGPESPTIDGAIIQYGRMAHDTTDILTQSAPTLLQRTNYFANPDFTLSAAGVTCDLGVPTHVATGGVDDGGFVHVTPNVNPNGTRINWAPDPTFANADPRLSGWRFGEGTSAVSAPSALPGGYEASFTRTPEAAAVRAEVSILGPRPGPQVSTVSLHLGIRAADVIFRVRDNLDQLVGTHVIPAGVAERVSFQSVLGAGYTVAFESPELQVLASALLIEIGAIAQAFFSGDTPDTGLALYEYVGLPLLSPSRRFPASITPVRTFIPSSALSGPARGGVRLRSRGGARVVLYVTDKNGDVIEEISDSNVDFDWETSPRTFYTPDGRDMGLAILSYGEVDIDKLVVSRDEGTAAQFLSGDTVAPAGYEVFWMGTPHNSRSRMRWLGDRDPDYTVNWPAGWMVATLPPLGDDDTSRRFLSVLNGDITGVQLYMAVRERIPMEDQLEPYERSYHRVSTVSGPTILRRMKLQRGSAIEVEIIFVAATPFAYSSAREIYLPAVPVTQIYSDTLDSTANVFVNPDGFGITGDLVTVVTNLATKPVPVTAGGWEPNDATKYPIAVDTVNVRRAGSSSSRSTRNTTAPDNTIGSWYAVGSSAYTHAGRSAVIPGDRISLSFYWMSPVVDASAQIGYQFFNAAGATVGFTVVANSPGGASAWRRAMVENLLVPAGAATVSIVASVLKPTITVGGETAFIQDAQVEVGAFCSPFVAGSLPPSDNTTFTYSWAGTANASPSLKRAALSANMTGGGAIPYRHYSPDGTVRFGLHSNYVGPGSAYVDLVSVSAVQAAGKMLTFVTNIYMDSIAGRTAAPRVSIISRVGLGNYVETALYAEIKTGAQELRVTQYIPVGATELYVRVYHGDTIGVPDLFFKVATVVLAAYTGPPFSGRTPTGNGFSYAWAAVQDASQSLRLRITNTADPLADPDCGPIPLAPRPPTIGEDCTDGRTDWRRYYVQIPPEDVALWAESVPTVTLSSYAAAVRQVRIRFYPNPFEWPAQQVDPESYCGEFILSYLPPNTELSVNGMTEEAWAQVAGGEWAPADTLLYGTDGGPMTWPALSCGLPYLMTVDIPVDEILSSNQQIELALNRRE